jgi:hypothetical protein
MIDCTEWAEITPENWQQVILDAIKELPGVIGHEVPDPNSLNVRLWGKQREIRFVWWNAYGEELTDQIKRYPRYRDRSAIGTGQSRGKNRLANHLLSNLFSFRVNCRSWDLSSAR